MKEYLLFEMKGSLFGFSIEDIKRIIMPVKIFKIPMQNKCMLGVIKVKENSDSKDEEVYNLIDLSLKINNEFYNHNNEDNKVILIKDENKKYAVIVDKVYNIEQIEDENISEVSFGDVKHKIAKISDENKNMIFTVLSKEDIFIWF